MSEPLSFTFPSSPGLDKVRTGITLDGQGAKLTIVGLVPCRCACHTQKVVIQYVVKGRGNEDPHRLDLAERMIRGSCPKRYEDAWSAAEDLTVILVNQYMERHDHCKGVVSG